MSAETKAGSSASIWFFIGLSLFVNGLLILGAGLYEYAYPPAPAMQVVLFRLHAGIWWGAFLTLLGGFYCWHYAPSRAR